MTQEPEPAKARAVGINHVALEVEAVVNHLGTELRAQALDADDGGFGHVDLERVLVDRNHLTGIILRPG